MSRTRLEAFSITVTGTLLSDLWFNFSHDHWTKLFQTVARQRGQVVRLAGPTEMERREAVAADADEFLICVGINPEHPDHAGFKEALIEDFFHRV